MLAMLSSKGQASFELLLLLAFVFTLSFFVAAYFFEESEQTSVEAKAKSVVLEALNKEEDFHYVNSVAYFKATNSFEICFRPDNPVSGRVKDSLIAAFPSLSLTDALITFKYTNINSPDCSIT